MPNDRMCSTVTLIDTRISTIQARRNHSIRNGVLCALIVGACVLIANPAAKIPLSDEFSYIKTAQDFALTGHIVYNGWATAMLGWLIPYGALIIKIFGLSFTGMRLSMLPIDMATVFLFHQILRRFGINAQNAVFGTLALALSPIFLPTAAGFMTDVPGLLVIFICLYACQRAFVATNDRIALAWLCFAAAANVAGGTVRQIAWLGALVMVPSTAWLLRGRRGMKIGGILLWIFSLFSVLICLHWFISQPYSVPEHIIWEHVRPMNFVHLCAALVKALLCLLLIVLPVSVAWLPTAYRLNRNAWLRFAGVVGFLIVFWGLAYATGRIDTWVMPWLMYLLAEQSSLVPGMFGTPVEMALWIRIAISAFVICSAVILFEQLRNYKQFDSADSDKNEMSWQDLGWILGPFALSYIVLLAPRGAFAEIQDRYLVGLAFILIIILLRLYQEQVAPNLPAVSLIVLAIYAAYSVAGTHDFFAESRAQVKALEMLESSGVPRKSIQAGFADDGWVQIQNGGHINESRIQVPAGAYHAVTPALRMIPEGCRNGFTKFTPVIVPKYFVLFPWFKNPLDPPPAWCFTQANYPPIHYTTWLPPFRATLYVQQIADRPHHSE